MFGLRRKADQRAIGALPWGQWGDEDGEGRITWAGPSVSTTSSLQLLTVYGCNRFICEGISTLPVDVFRKVGDDRVEVTAPQWVEEPTADLKRVAWLTQVLTSLLLDGNAYLRLVYDERVNLRELVPLNPAAVKPTRENGRKVYRVNGVEVPSFEILHIPGVMFPGAEEGMSPVEAARQTIGSGMAVGEFAARFFGQGANLGGVIEDPGPPDPEKAKLFARTWARLHSGNAKAHLPGVLQGGATWKTTGVTNEQAQFLETRQFTAAEIAAFMFLIDPTEFGLSMGKGSNITYANLEQRNVRLVQRTYLPWLVRIETALSMVLAKPRYYKFNVSGLLRGDTKTRWETYEVASRINTAARANGDTPVLLSSEMRGYEDLPPIDPADLPAAPAPAAVPAASEEDEDA